MSDKKNTSPFRIKKVGPIFKYHFIDYDDWEKLMNQTEDILTIENKEEWEDWNQNAKELRDLISGIQKRIEKEKMGEGVDKLVQKVYHTRELQDILDDVIQDFIDQVVLMSDKELNEDRSEWIKNYSDYDKDDEYKYHTSVHTIAIELEQLRRWNKIIYDLPKKSVRLD